MQVRTKLAVLVLSLVLLSGGAAAAQEPQEKPGGMHKQLAKMAGDWTFTNRMWLAPGQPPQEWSGTMQAETILGGRYVQSVWKGKFMGQDYEGHGTEGYDNAQQYVSSYLDSMAGSIVLSTGACEDGGKKCTTTHSAGPATMKTVLSWIDDNSFKTEMFMRDPASGQENKVMEIVAKRK